MTEEQRRWLLIRLNNNRMGGGISPSGSTGQTMEAIGGTVITYKNRKIHIITSSGDFEILSASEGATFDYLIVAAGGGGGNGYGGIGGGGGGAGGVITGTASASVGVLPAVIGNGGAGAGAGVPDTNGVNGGNTTFNGLTAIGGGGGNSYDNPTSGSGGSAGGCSYFGTSGTATSGQGNIGGLSTGASPFNGGGGGGGGYAGANGSASSGGNGGDGIESLLAGISAYFGGGGGGAVFDNVDQGVGGLGGGGRGAYGPDHDGVDAIANTGGGGGGGYLNDGAGGNGGSGIVIISYEFMPSCLPNLDNVALTSNLIEAGTSGYSTFQSNNQKVVQNANGIFVVYIRTATAVYTAQTWRLKQSTDGGATFTTLYDDDSAYSAPAMETDSSGNLYLIAPLGATDAKFYKFLASDYTTPSVTTTLTGLSSDKITMALDEANDRVYCGSISNKFVALDLDGVVVTGPTTLTQDGSIAVNEYPNLQVDNLGNLYCAITTQEIGASPINYYNILWFVSRDLGVTWEKADGTGLSLPITMDTTTTNQVTRNYDVGANTFLSSFIYANERLHFLYYLDDGGNDYQQVYVRINPTTGAEEIRTIQPLVCNPTVSGLDGFFIRDTFGTFASPDILRVVTTYDNRYLVSGISEDNGETWNRNKILDTAPATGWRLYASGGFRQLVGSTYGYGTFTHQNLATNPVTGSGDTYFIKMEI